MRLITLATCLLGLCFNSFAQNFEPAPNSSQEKLETFIKRFGSFDKVFLSDADKKTFVAEPGKEYFIGFTFETNDESVRRMMVVQLGANGEKIKMYYPKSSRAVKDGKKQIFLIDFVAPSDVSGSNITYRVDASPTSTVYIYRVTRGVNRDITVPAK